MEKLNGKTVLVTGSTDAKVVSLLVTLGTRGRGKPVFYGLKPPHSTPRPFQRRRFEGAKVRLDELE